jgi:DnaJ family protein C protein 13
MDKMERDRLVLFINKLIQHRRNVKDIMDAGGVRILVDLLTLAHLHTSRYGWQWLAVSERQVLL